MKMRNIYLIASIIDSQAKSINKFNNACKSHPRTFAKVILTFFAIFFYCGFKRNFYKYDFTNKITAVIITAVPILIIIRLSWTDYKRKHRSPIKKAHTNTTDFDSLDGIEFENFCAYILKKNGFKKVTTTKTTGDQGLDIIAFKNGKKYGFQCKRYSKPIGNSAVQEVFSGAQFYNCDYAVVITNQVFTKSAIELSKKLNVILYDRTGLNNLITTAK